MTTDHFTEAARAEAERRWPRVARRNKTAEEWLDEGMGSGFVLGAQWGRDQTLAQMKQKVAAAHQERNKALAQARKAEELLRNIGEHLAEQEPTDAEVLAALNAHDPATRTPNLRHYAPSHVEAMRAALSAARRARGGAA